MMLFCLMTSAIFAVFPRLRFVVVAGQIMQQNDTNAACNCDCSIFQSSLSCSVQRFTTRIDCPCCQTCLRQAGELCDIVAFPCDEEFGLICNQKTDTCEGSFGLQAADKTFSGLHLVWFHPAENRERLYVFYTPKYTDDIRRWIMQETYAPDSAHIQGLQAATHYYITLVPEFKGEFYFDNRSEIIVVKTEGCLHKNQSYAVGETFSDGCAYNCTCTPEGLLACIERKCPLVYKKGDIRDPLCKENDDPASPDPCCVIYTCQNAQPSSATNDGSCVYKGKHYELSREFFDEDCSKLCYCDEIGVVDCRPLKCPQPLIPLHYNGSCLEWGVRQHAVRSPPNCCPTYFCINEGTCNVNNTVYQSGATVPSTCDQHCLCDRGKIICESTCPEVSHDPPTDPNCAHFILSKDSSECCREWRCMSRASPSECFQDNVSYAITQTWTDRKNCRQRHCTCWRNSKGVAEAVCSGGCPTISVESLKPSAGCHMPFLITPENPCLCPFVICQEKGFDEAQIAFQQDDPGYNLNAGIINATTAQMTVNISSGLPWQSSAILETHVALVQPPTSRNVSDIWQIFSTKLDRLQPVIEEYISGFEENATYKVKTRLVLTDPSLEHYIILPFSALLHIHIPLRGPVCIVANKTYDEGAIVPRGCGQECLCQNSTVVCHTVEVQCNIQDSVLLPSEFCPIPVIVKGPDECCPRWECHPAATGCKAGNSIFAHGDQWRNGCAEQCTCRNGAVACRDLCDEQQRSQPHPSCKSVVVPGSCCPVWSCHEGAAMPVVDFSHDIDNSNMNLTVDSITSTGSRLTWQRPAELRNINGFTLYIQETLMERESYRELKLIHPEVQEYFVHDLSPATQYTATLKALEEGNRVVASQSLQLQTLDISGIVLLLWLGDIGSDKAEAIWECQRCDGVKALKLNLVSSSNSGPAVGDVKPDLPKITLTALTPRENYQLWLEGVTTAGLALKSNVVAFVTQTPLEFNEIAREYQNGTDPTVTLPGPTILSLDTEQQRLSTALMIVSVFGIFFLVAFLLALALCCYYRKQLVIQKTTGSPYHTYTTDNHTYSADTMYR